MGIRNMLRRVFKPLAGPTVFFEPSIITNVMGLSPGELYRTQPHLRTVISFMARNVAQLPLHVYERVSDTDRRRVKGEPASLLLERPNPHMTQYELIYDLISSLKLYDVALWLVARDESEAGASIYPIRPAWITATGGGDVWGPEWIEVRRPGQGETVKIVNDDATRFVLFHGWNPDSPDEWASPVETLKEILEEQIQAWTYRRQVWQRGGRAGMYLKRPLDAPQWSPEARQKFARDWQAAWAGPHGAAAGGTPLLEEGMTLEETPRFNAREEEWAEVSKLALSTVASVYHINPTMIGVNDGANYSNVREFHKMLYQDSLGPDLAMIEQRINSFVIPFITDNRDVYAEFNLQAKLAGTFEEQAAILSASVGAPWLSRNEARARMNLPRVDGGDEIITPLNVLVGGQASPRDSGSQNLGGGLLSGRGPAKKVSRLETPAYAARSKALGRVTRMLFDEAGYKQKYEAGLRQAFADMTSDLVAYYASKPQTYHVDKDEREWYKNLISDALKEVSGEQNNRVYNTAREMLGLQRGRDWKPGDDIGEHLAHRADTRAEAMVEDMVNHIEYLLDHKGDFRDPASYKQIINDCMNEFTETYAPWRAKEHAHQVQGWATQGAALAAEKETGGTMYKTWVTTSGNPRSQHAYLDGETIPVDDAFSNGLQYPGDSNGAPEDFVNCECVLEYSLSGGDSDIHYQPNLLNSLEGILENEN